MFTFLESFAQGEIHVSGQGWLYKLYAYWLEHNNGRAPWHRENLCHFMRAALIKAPLTWFFEARWRHFLLRPVTVVISFLIVAWAGLAIALLTTITWRSVLGVFLLSAYLLTGTFLGVWFVEEVKEDRNPWGDRLFVLLSPLFAGTAFIFLLLIAGVEEAVKRIQPGRRFDWAVDRLSRFFAWLTASWRWAILLALALAGSFIWNWRMTLLLVTLISLIAIGLVVLFLAACEINDGIDRLSDWRRRRRGLASADARRPSPARETLGLILHFLAAAKRKVCPLIVFDFPSEN